MIRLLLLLSAIWLAESEIPPLNVGDPNTFATVWDLVEQCEAIEPNRRSPSAGQGLEMTFIIERFIEIADVLQQIAIRASMYVKWGVHCPPNSLVTKPTRILVTNTSEVWLPGINFANAINDISMHDSNFANRTEILVTTDPGSEYNTFFYLSRHGIFQAGCSLSLGKFPFDTQNCGFEFNLVEANHLVHFNRLEIRPPESQGVSDNWIIENDMSYELKHMLDMNDNVSKAIFKVNFKRRPEYFLINLLSPCIVLSTLELVAFLIPPNESDRICFSVYLLLALAVCQSLVLREIPKTPQWVMLNYLIQLLFLVSSLCTGFAIIMFWYVCHNEATASRKCGKLSFISVVDILGFIFFLALFIAAAVFCMVQGGVI